MIGEIRTLGTYNNLNFTGGEMTNYSLWLVEYGKGLNQARSWAIAGEHNKGLIENTPFTYLVGRGEGHTFLIDVGFDDNSRTHEMLVSFGVTAYENPENCLRKLGIKPGEIDTIFLTHAHFDHAGNLEAFPNATFYLQKKELYDWINWLSLPERLQYFSFPIDKQNISELVELAINNRCVLVDGEMKDVLPGINLIPAFDTHSFGLQYVSIMNGSDKWVCVSDNAHEYENITGINNDGIIRPVSFLTGSYEKTIISLDNALHLANDINHLILFHAQGTFDRFPSKVFEDGLRISELTLAVGQPSLIQ